MKKILYYNWIPFDDAENRGGGVTVYQRNLIEEFIKDKDYNLYFICSGLSYNFLNKHPFIEQYDNCFGKHCHSYRIVNSPVLSPGHCNFNNISAFLNDRELLDLLDDFIKEHGPFDVIHFNNFEGLSLKVFKLKEIYPKTKFIYSLHNYYSFCPQVNLWKNEMENCKDNHMGKDCVHCVSLGCSKESIIKANIAIYYLNKIGISNKNTIWNLARKGYVLLKKIKKNLFPKNELKKITSPAKGLWYDFVSNADFLDKANEYQTYISESVHAINEYVDTVLAVSNRVKKIAIDKGIYEKKVITNYIGTKFAKNQLGKSAHIYDGNILNIIYMGYARSDKGFFFFMDCLEAMPEAIAKKISVHFAVRTDDIYILSRMRNLRNKYAKVYFKNGYTHNEMKELLNTINLGIVPVLWEDNLPQVAIELNAEGIPVLSSNLGGASELSLSESFRFIGGDVNDFIYKLTNIVENKNIIEDYWNKRMILKNMDEHIKELKSIYNA